LLIDSQIREQLLSLAADFPRIWNDPKIEPRERKRILRLLIEDVTLVKEEMIQVHVRLRGGATRSLTVAKPLPIAQIRKTMPAVVSTNRWERTSFIKAVEAETPSNQFSPLYKLDEVQYET